jgi:FkbM family methyltransferase
MAWPDGRFIGSRRHRRPDLDHVNLMRTHETRRIGAEHTRSGAASSVDQLLGAMQRHYPGLHVHHLQKIAIVGAAGEGGRLSELCRKRGIEVAAIADDHPSKVGTELDGRRVRPVSELDSLDRGMPVIIASHRVLSATERLRGLGFRLVLPFAALQVMAPDLFPPHMFYAGLLDDLVDNRDKYAWLEGSLADARSRDVLNAVLSFRQTLDPLMLKPVLDDDDLYAPKGLIRFSDDEIYVDGGSYDGDSIRMFIKSVGGRYHDIFAFEPDPVTFAKLIENFANESRVHAIHAGLYSCMGNLRFRDDGSRGAIFAQDGEAEIAVTTIDDAVGGKAVSYIKMNIEGAEIEALRGGARTIRKFLPKLAISAYHYADHLWKIPQLVRELSPQYDLYLRQHDGGIIETVLYALPRAAGAQTAGETDE